MLASLDQSKVIDTTVVKTVHVLLAAMMQQCRHTAPFLWASRSTGAHLLPQPPRDLPAAANAAQLAACFVMSGTGWLMLLAVDSIKPQGSNDTLPGDTCDEIPWL